MNKYVGWRNSKELQKLEEIIGSLKKENEMMYNVISAAGESGNERCRIELGRIADSDVLRDEAGKEKLY